MAGVWGTQCLASKVAPRMSDNTLISERNCMINQGIAALLETVKIKEITKDEALVLVYSYYRVDVTAR